MAKLGKMAQLAVWSLMVVSCSNSSFGQHDREWDGKWWLAQSSSVKEYYFAGFYAGMELGNKFSYWGSGYSAADPRNFQVAKAYDEMCQKYFHDVTVGVIVDALDDFYTDSRNRVIPVPDAAWLVVQKIAGTPREQLQKSIESFRINSIPERSPSDAHSTSKDTP